jgi:hypothetical protein
VVFVRESERRGVDPCWAASWSAPPLGSRLRRKRGSMSGLRRKERRLTGRRGPIKREVAKEGSRGRSSLSTAGKVVGVPREDECSLRRR